MNKTELKTFAVQARRDLLEKVALRAKLFGIDEKNGLKIDEQFGQLVVNKKTYPIHMKSAFVSLERVLRIKGYEQLLEEVAYTWFNRIIAIRYMEVHGYLPERVHVLSSSTGKAEPDILVEYERLNIDVNKQEIAYHIHNGEVELAFRKLIVAQCNALHKILPFLFEEINDYTELLLPDFLLDQESVIRKLTRGVSKENFIDIDSKGEKKDNVEILGWLYQYYMSEKKERVGGLRNSEVKKENLPVVTQLFTPKWIVQYMVQNSLGKLYDEKTERNSLGEKWDYYIRHKENKKLYPEFKQLEDLKLVDPACGSGHVLVYAFDMFYEMYEEQGYPSREIPKLILENNLFGLDIDKRAQQIASFALVMKACEKYSRLLSRSIRKKEILKLNIYEVVDTDESLSNEAIDYFVESDHERKQIHLLLNLFDNGKQFGSLLTPPQLPYKEMLQKFDIISKNDKDLIEISYFHELKLKLLPLIQQGLLLSQKYDVVVTNPPYHNKYNSQLKLFMNKEYKDYKSDLYSAFIYRLLQMTKENGYASLMTPYTWMFISTHEKLRRFIIQNQSISSLVQLEYSAFKDATVPICCFVIQNQTKQQIGEYIRLSDLKGKQDVFVCEAAKNRKISYRFSVDGKQFDYIPGSPIAYWTSEGVRNTFSLPKIKDVAEVKTGIITTDNEQFLRHWYEVNYPKINFSVSSIEKTNHLVHKWYPYNKGGAFRKWYGNGLWVINWKTNGLDVKRFIGTKYEHIGRKIVNVDYHFKESVTWSDINSSYFGARMQPTGSMFDISGPSAFFRNSFIGLAILNSIFAKECTKILNPTLHVTTGDVRNIPFVDNISQEKITKLNNLVEENIKISKTDWDENEVSWEFIAHPFLQFKEEMQDLNAVFEKWCRSKQSQFLQLKSNEEQLNRIILQLYNLEEELAAEVSDREITISDADRDRDSKSFLSYFIGCVMGRYSCNVDGLIFAGGDWDESKYQSFRPTEHGVVLLTDDRYFNNDIIIRLREFLAVNFSFETVEENLSWLAESLTMKKNETAEERLRRYFIDEFFKDHLKTYQKRPIYWLVDSGKQKGLRTLIYMHRYQPETLATIRFEHLQEIQAKYTNEISMIDSRLVNPNLSATEKRDFERKKKVFQKRLEELVDFDKNLATYANKQIEIDLDDGVKVNYEKFKSVLAKI